MKVLVCLSVLLVAQSMGQVGLPIKRDWNKIYEKWANPSIPREEPRPEENPPLRAGTKDLRAVCGVPNDAARIINGVEAVPHSLPWVAALFISGGSFCTASLISDQWVLTAAHCADGALFFDVYLGAHNVRVTEPERLEIRATEKYIHPDWRPALLTGDVALIKLPAPVDISGPNVRPICLQDPTDQSDYVGVKAQLAGWGKTSDASSSISPTLQRTGSTIISNEECKQTYAIVNNNTICTSFDNTGTCNGDSGSAMSVIGADGRWTQIGVTSFVSGAGCESGYPDGFARLRGFLPWISSITGLVF